MAVATVLFEQDKTGKERVVPAAPGGFVRLRREVHILFHFHALTGEVRPDFFRACHRTGQQAAELALEYVLCQVFTDYYPSSTWRGATPQDGPSLL